MPVTPTSFHKLPQDHPNLFSQCYPNLCIKVDPNLFSQSYPNLFSQSYLNLCIKVDPNLFTQSYPILCINLRKCPNQTNCTVRPFSGLLNLITPKQKLFSNVYPKQKNPSRLIGLKKWSSTKNRSPQRSMPRHPIVMASTAKPPDLMPCALAAVLLPESHIHGCHIWRRDGDWRRTPPRACADVWDVRLDRCICGP